MTCLFGGRGGGGPEACLAEPPTFAHRSFPPSQVNRQRFLGNIRQIWPRQHNVKLERVSVRKKTKRTSSAKFAVVPLVNSLSHCLC